MNYDNVQSVHFSTDIERANYDRVVEFMRRRNPSTNFIINQSSLLIEKVLVDNQSNYEFDLYENKTSDRNLEVKLNRNDLFFATHIGLSIRQQDAVAGNYANYPLFTYPDQQVFLGVPASGLAEYQCLEALYAGLITIVTSPVKRLENFPTFHLRYVPEQQEDTTNNFVAGYGATNERRGLFPLSPMIILDGYENNTVELEVGEGDLATLAGGIDAMAGSLDTSNIAVIIIHGFKVLNGSQKVGRWTAI